MHLADRLCRDTKIEIEAINPRDARATRTGGLLVCTALLGSFPALHAAEVEVEVEVELTIVTDQAGATIRVDDRPYTGPMSLSPGDYQLEVSADGYQSLTRPITLNRPREALAVLLDPVVPVARGANSPERHALLIGNKDYNKNVGELDEPVNDVKKIKTALEQVQFSVELVDNAGLDRMNTALDKYARTLRQAGNGAIGFFYYSGHGAANPDDEQNYLFPVSVSGIDDPSLWRQSLRLSDLIDQLGDIDATQFVVIDACRNELRPAAGTKGVRRTGFRGEQQRSGMLIAYSTAAGEVAWDNGVFATELSEQLISYNVDAVAMFRDVQLAVEERTGQVPYIVYSIPRTVFASPTWLKPASGDMEVQVTNTAATVHIGHSETPVGTATPGSPLRVLNVREGRVVVSARASGYQTVRRIVKIERDRLHETTLTLALPDAQLADLATFHDTLRDGTPGPEMVVIPNGAFRMGDTARDETILDWLYRGAEAFDEWPVHEVVLGRRFAASAFEVTVAQYDQFAVATGERRPQGERSHPVRNVLWPEAVHYTKWLSSQTGNTYRLPTEAEWEYVARANSATRFWWGDEFEKNRAHCSGCESQWDSGQPAPVGQFAANDFGLHDISGNVAEWVQDCYSRSYQGAPGLPTAIETDSCRRRVLRGGAFTDEPAQLRVSHRKRALATKRDPGFGFRIVRALRQE